jgi:hypothetical protein
MSQNPNNPSRPPIPPALAIAFGILAVSTASIFIRYAQQEAPSLVIAAWRLTIATSSSACRLLSQALDSTLSEGLALAPLSVSSSHCTLPPGSPRWNTPPSPVPPSCQHAAVVALICPALGACRRMLLIGRCWRSSVGYRRLVRTRTWTMGGCSPLRQFVGQGAMVTWRWRQLPSFGLMIGRRLRAAPR